MEPIWLSGAPSVEGTVEALIPGHNDTPAAVVILDQSLQTAKGSGDRAVLELRYVGAAWGATGVVHVELCDFSPEATTWKDRRQGVWVESHATYERLT